MPQLAVEVQLLLTLSRVLRPIELVIIFYKDCNHLWTYMASESFTWVRHISSFPAVFEQYWSDLPSKKLQVLVKNSLASRPFHKKWLSYSEIYSCRWETYFLELQPCEVLVRRRYHWTEYSYTKKVFVAQHHTLLNSLLLSFYLALVVFRKFHIVVAFLLSHSHNW